MKLYTKLFALILALLILLTGCVGPSENNTETSSVGESEITTVAESISETEEAGEPPMSEYRASISRSRAELEEMLTLEDSKFAEAEALLKQFEELALVSDDLDAIDALYQEFEDAFYHLDTQISIANIIYYLDMTDEDASSKYLESYALYGDLYNAYVESCKKVYESSPIRDELFADWTEEEIREMLSYDPETQELRETNEELLVELNALPASTFYDRSAEIYAQLVTNNNRIAELCGFDNYYDYASSEIYGRDYSKEDIDGFTEYIVQYYLPAVELLGTRWQKKYAGLNSKNGKIMYNYLFRDFDEMDKNYLQLYIDSYGDSSTHDGLSHVFENRNVIFSDSTNSHQSAFQIYLTELETPFCFFGYQGQTTETLVHEMGHYYAALYNEDVNSFDLAETQSQANEMLLLNFLADEMPADAYSAVKDYTLYTFVVESVVCCIVDEFERAVYALDSVEGYTSEEFDAIMIEVCEKYGGIDSLGENIVDPNDYWRLTATNTPVYYISYAISMTEALNVYSAAKKDRAAGREIYRVLIEEIDEDESFLEAMEKAGLSGPFEEQTFIDILNSIRK